MRWSDPANSMCFVMRIALWVRLLLVIVGFESCVGCSSSKLPSGERIMFTAFGPHAFEGRVLVARPDGTHAINVLNPQGMRGYESAYGNSLNASILVSAVQSTGGNNSITNLVQYFPYTGHSASLQQQLPVGEEGAGVPAPDNSQFVAEIGPGASQQINLWISNFQTRQYRQLTQGSAQDSLETWSPDGHEIVFLRLLPPFPSITTQLMMISSQGGEPKVLLGTSDGVAEAAYSPDGKKLAFNSTNGLETMELSSGQRTVIITLEQLHGNPLQRFTQGRGISWAKTQDTIVLVMHDLATNLDQLWTISSDGSKLQKIYTADRGVSIFSVTFIMN